MPRALVFAAMVAGVFLMALDMYVVASVLPTFIDDFGIPVDHLERATPIISGFLVGYVAAMPLAAGLSDRRGRTLVYCACLVAFAVGSVITASATDLRALVIGRSLQGAAGGAVVPLTFAAAADVFGVRRLLALGLVAGFQELGSLLGPIYGAVVARFDAQHLSWRLIFWLNLPLAAVCLGVFLVASLRSRGESEGEVASWDPLSSLLVGGALAALVLALYPSDPSGSAVNTAQVFVPAILVAAALAAVFAWRTARGFSFVSMPLLRSLGFSGTLATNVLVGGALAAALVEIPLLARTVFSLDELGAAGLLARFMAGIPVGALAGGWLGERTGVRPVLLIGLLIAAASFFLMSGWDAAALQRRVGVLPTAYAVLVAAGLGFGLVIAPLTSAVLERGAQSEHGRAASTVVLARMVGMVVGLALLSGLGLHHFYDLVNAPPRPNPVFGTPDFFNQVAALQRRYNSALLAEYRQIFLIAAGLCVAAALVALATIRGVAPTRTPPSAPRTADASAAGHPR